MHTGLQVAIEAFASSGELTRALFVFLAAYLVFLMGAVWCGLALAHGRAISFAVIVRVVLTFALALILARVFGHIVSDPRPYLVTHTQPLAPVSADNGFPSDHVLLASALAYTVWWIDRRWLVAFVVGMVLVALGRMGIGAHHLEDVIGSAVIALGAFAVAAVLPLPTAWQRPVLTILRPGTPASAPRDSRR